MLRLECRSHVAEKHGQVSFSSIAAASSAGRRLLASAHLVSSERMAANEAFTLLVFDVR